MPQPCDFFRERVLETLSRKAQDLNHLHFQHLRKTADAHVPSQSHLATETPLRCLFDCTMVRKGRGRNQPSSSAAQASFTKQRR